MAENVEGLVFLNANLNNFRHGLELWSIYRILLSCASTIRIQFIFGRI